MPLFFWYSEPRTDEKRTKAMGAVGDYLEFGSTNPSISVQKRQFPPEACLGREVRGERDRRGGERAFGIVSTP